MNEKKTQKVDKKKYAKERQYFTLRKNDLASLVAQGDERAQKEVERRLKKRAKKIKVKKKV
jgi:hypothetical protein